MTNTTDADAGTDPRLARALVSREWSQLLLHAAPSSRLPGRDSPRRKVVDFIADQLAEETLFQPVVLDLNELLPATVREQLLEDAFGGDVQVISHDNRRVADAPAHIIAKILQSGLWDLAQSAVPIPLARDCSAAFLYYGEGESLRLHVDNSEAFEFNLLACLQRQRPADGRKSATYFLPSGSAVKAWDMDPGQGILFHSAKTPHGRTPLAADESIVILTVGFWRAE